MGIHLLFILFLAILVFQLKLIWYQLVAKAAFVMLFKLLRSVFQQILIFYFYFFSINENDFFFYFYYNTLVVTNAKPTIQLTSAHTSQPAFLI